MAKVDPRWIRGKLDTLAIAEGCYFDQQHANRAIDFIESLCRRTKGRGDRRIKLIPWQHDFVARLFGWMRPDGTRRYRTAYVEVPKKNGKSFLMSAIALYMVMADGEGAAEVYLAATNSKQARIVFDECSKMIRSHPALKKRLTVQDTLKSIRHRPTFSKIECATLDSDALDGWDMSCGIVDEYHRHKTSRLMDVLRYAGSAREQPLLVVITTAGNDRTSPCWKEHELAVKVERGESADVSHLAVIYAADPLDPLEDPKTWYKANPSLGHTLSLEDFQRDLDKVRESPQGLNNFKRLRLNIWVSPDTAFITPEHWDKCSRPIDLKALEGQTCYGGMDMSSKKDITSLVLLFGDETAGYTYLAWFWIPEQEARERQRNHEIPYDDWRSKGLVEYTPGNGIDYDMIVDKIVELSKTYRIKSIWSDQWGSSEAVGQKVKKHGVKVEFMHQGFRMSEPTKELERQAIRGNINHGGNEILTWMNANAIVKSDSNANICLVKPSPDSPKKIDGLIAMIEALHGEMRSRRKTSVYNTMSVEQLLGEKPKQ